MISLLYLLIVPLLGLIALLVNRREKRISDMFLLLLVFIVDSALFFVGIIVGFSTFNLMLVPSIDFAFSLGITGISLPFLLLAVALPALGLVSLYDEIKDDRNLFSIVYLISYLSLIGVFVSTNLLSFFIFWEFILVAFFFVIAFWGEEERRRIASMKFLIFTQFGSLTLLAAFILLFIYTGSFNLITIQSASSSLPAFIAQVCFFLVLVTALIKMPIFPFHSWLPDAHVTAPTAGSILLAGVLLKMGGYALIQFGVLLFPSVVRSFQVPLLILGIFTTIYITLVASAQKDLKKIIAYSSIFYMSLAFIGAVSLSNLGLDGAIFLMVSHGFIAGMLFALAGILKEKTGTRLINELGGLAKNLPMFAFFIMFSVIATLGVPGLSNFIGELVVFFGSYQVYPFVLLALIGALVSTFYYTNAAKLMLFSAQNKKFSGVTDISTLEMLQLGLFSVFILVLGILPGILFGGITL